MKRLGIIIVTIMALSAMSTVSWATIVGSPHDLSGAGYGTNQICIFCHTPHNAQTANVPLWNHGNSTVTYTLYDSASLDAVPGQPSDNSKACLSCHDGTVALDSYGGLTGTNFIDGAANLGGANLGNDHPISFTYDAALVTADTASSAGVQGLATPASTSLVVAGVPLYGAKVECASCHNVHEPGTGDFLRMSNAQSALCLKCHLK